MLPRITCMRFAICAGAIALATSATFGWADDIPISELPQAVVKAIQERFPKAELKEAEKDDDRGELHYDVDLRHQGREVDVTVTARGEITEIEQRLTAEELPQPVAGAVQAKYPQARYIKIKETRRSVKGKEQPTLYQLHITTADRRDRELEVTPAGRIVEDDDD